jgi:hypothetical protein
LKDKLWNIFNNFFSYIFNSSSIFMSLFFTNWIFKCSISK